MSKPVLFVLISAVLFLGLLYGKDIFFAEEPVPVEPEPIIETVKVLRLVKPVNKGSFYSELATKAVEISEVQAKNNGLLTEEQRIPDGALYREPLSENTYLKRDLIAYPSDKDYVNFTLSEDHVPYYYTTNGKSAADAIGLSTGDTVSFISTTSQYSNINNSGYKDISNIITKVLVHKARIVRVIDVNEESQQDGVSINKKQIVVELKINDVMKLDIATRISKITVVPANMVNQYLSVRSVDILEKQHGVRELRAGAK
ncbi:hypothetical protein [Vibrio nigripulchritudo]|uniref:hypothetical protein n=1 Tax=Vibrio nigripulchritudo TaxID=28173 RepID=UPI0003B1F6BC|nr:hypothetical protein [Vibrio nigripulchritudo]CCN71191.1 conserved exported hypothetical protein [Vibrio nigripulchritudo SFn118]